MPERGRSRHQHERQRRQGNQTLSRRSFLRIAAVGAAATAAVVYGLSRSSQNEIPGKPYDGEVTSLRGQEVIPEKEMVQYLEALENCSVPFLRKMGADIRELSVAESKPEGLPSWVSEGSFPMAFTKGVGPDSRAVLDILWNNQSPYAFKVDWQEHGVVENPFAYTAWMGTYLGLTESLKDREPLVKGLFLAKEHMSHMVMQRLSEDFSEQLDFFRINGISELDGSPITDASRFKQATVSIFLNQQTSRETTIWKTVDGLPAFYAAHSFNQLVNSGELPAEDGRAVGRFLDAHRIILNDLRANSDAGLKLLVGHMEEWMSTDSLLAPSRISDAYRPPIRNMVDEWHEVAR